MLKQSNAYQANESYENNFNPRNQHEKDPTVMYVIYQLLRANMIENLSNIAGFSFPSHILLWASLITVRGSIHLSDRIQ